MSVSNVRLLLIDNYDSFTYNLVQAFMILGAESTYVAMTKSLWNRRKPSRPRTCAFRRGRARLTTRASAWT
jgi:anthranilate/para-aminobenzoate synthase component II